MSPSFEFDRTDRKTLFDQLSELAQQTLPDRLEADDVARRVLRLLDRVERKEGAARRDDAWLRKRVASQCKKAKDAPAPPWADGPEDRDTDWPEDGLLAWFFYRGLDAQRASLGV